MADTYGLLALPAPAQAPTAVVTDPGLAILLDWFRTLLTANLATAWTVFAPSEPVVRNAFSRDPAPADFSEKLLPAIYCWRDTQADDITGDDIQQDTTSLSLLWVYPPADQFKQAVRLAVQNGLVKSLARAVFLGRDPSWYASSVGTDQILNSSFAVDAIWVKGAGWTIPVGGVAVAVLANTTISEPAILVVGKTYRVTTIVATRTAGSVRAMCGTTAGAARSAPGTYTENLVCSGNTTFALSGAGFSGTIDNVKAELFTDESAVLHGSLVRAAAGLCRPLMPEKPFARAADVAVAMADGSAPIKYPAIRFGMTICEELTLSSAAEAPTDYHVDIFGREAVPADSPLFEFDSP